MTKKNSTKRSLIASILVLCLCITSFVGTTFAWFTDSVTSANNVIKSGTLDIILEYYDTESKSWKDVKGSSDILTGDLWEPGYTDVAYLRIKNNGSLALKYALSVNIISETEGVNRAGDSFLLSDYIYFDVEEGKQPEFANRNEAMATVDTPTKISKGFSSPGHLEAETDFVYLAMVVFMPNTVGNEANHDGVHIPEIDLGINIFATQYTVESDSFDEKYDEQSAVFTVADANDLIEQNRNVTLVNCNEPDGVIEVHAGYTGTITLVSTNIKSVQAAENVNLIIVGNVVVDAGGSGVSSVASVSGIEENGSAISAKGTINISGDGNLTAIADEKNGAFGIGGIETKAINIKDVTIVRAEGGYSSYVADTVADKYLKECPEGGAAIGSGYNGAVINIENATVINAIGGSKSAGIGARYWTGVTVNIKDSAIAYVQGGASAAAIGASRVSEEATESATVINITNSEITAVGGAYGAGIGSGYDTHCGTKQPMCTVNISDSTINATGGKYAAGVGTGYHNAALTGKIENSTVNARSGEKFYKDSYTVAQNIGFGVVDPSREGQQVDSVLYYHENEICIPKPGRLVYNLEEMKAAIADPDVAAIYFANNIKTAEQIDVTRDVLIDGNGYILSRAPIAVTSDLDDSEIAYYTGNILNVKSGKTLELANVTVDGGASWTGECNEVLERGTVNSGVTATGALVVTESKASIVLGKGAILQNNDGANAVNLSTRVGATLVINGGEIINNHSAAGAIWGGGEITLNSGKINGNHGGIGGAIRVVTNIGTVLTMNGGEMNHNLSDGVGGAIWAGTSRSNNVYVLNGGEMAYNYSASTGGAIYAGHYETVKIGGTFKMHDNSCPANIGGGIRFHDHASLVMTGGEIYDNYADGKVDNFFLNNNSASITGGKINGTLTYSGGLGLVMGEAEIDGVISYNLGTNHNTAYLAAEFGSFKFTVNESAANFAQFNFNPADDYVYTEGDEDKLICMNEGYETYWDADADNGKGLFKIRETN